jgi:hypothetical protein
MDVIYFLSKDSIVFNFLLSTRGFEKKKYIYKKYKYKVGGVN